MTKYQAILFDFDGVLADSEPLHYECWREVLKPYGIDLLWSVYSDKCIGVSDREMIEGFCHGQPVPIDLEAVWKEYPRKQALFRERIANADVFVPETIELVHSLAAYKMAVVSSSNRHEIEPPLIQAGIRHRFEALVCGSEEVERLKPAPDPYILAARKLQVENALVVEDSDAGERSGRAAGFDVVRVYNAREVAAKVRAALG
jgi:HAD superfamily hydrolase (TIGR01509 family)